MAHNVYYRRPENRPVLEFHPIHSDGIRLEHGKRVAVRSEEFRQGAVFSNRPISIDERVCFLLSKFATGHHSVMQWGVTSVDPASLESLALLERIECRSRKMKYYWAPNQILSTTISEGSLLQFYVSQLGEIRCNINGEDERIVLRGVPTNCSLWVVADLCGAAKEIEFVRPHSQFAIGQEYETSESTLPIFPSLPSHSLCVGCSGLDAPPSAPSTRAPPLPPRRNVNPATPSPTRVAPPPLPPRPPTGQLQQPVQPGRMADWDWSWVSNETTPPSRAPPNQTREGSVRSRDRGVLASLSATIARIGSRASAIGNRVSTSISQSRRSPSAGSGGVATPSAPPETPPLHRAARTIRRGYGMIQMTSSSTVSSPSECAICLDAPVDSVMSECGHMSACYECAVRTKQDQGVCPICRKPIKDVIKVYQT